MSTRKQRNQSIISGTILLIATIACGCNRVMTAHYQIPPIAKRDGIEVADSSRFLDALTITDKVAKAYYLNPDSCPPTQEQLDCRSYSGSVEVCAFDCWHRPVSFVISMEPRFGSFDLTFNHGTGTFRSSEAEELESEIVTRLQKEFGLVVRVDEQARLVTDTTSNPQSP